MNYYEFCKGELISRGIFESQAVEIMKNVIDKDNPMDGRWHEDTTSYPPMLKNLVWMNVEHEALEYIKINCPQAWFRPIFDTEHPLRKEFEALQSK